MGVEIVCGEGERRGMLCCVRRRKVQQSTVYSSALRGVLRTRGSYKKQCAGNEQGQVRRHGTTRRVRAGEGRTSDRNTRSGNGTGVLAKLQSNWRRFGNGGGQSGLSA